MRRSGGAVVLRLGSARLGSVRSAQSAGRRGVESPRAALGGTQLGTGLTPVIAGLEHHSTSKLRCAACDQRSGFTKAKCSKGSSKDDNRADYICLFVF